MRVSFIHHGDGTWASYRYRAARPAAHLGASMNDLSADVVIFSKPMPEDVDAAWAVKDDGRRVIVDYCDDHFDSSWAYLGMLRFADAVTCPTEDMRARVEGRLEALRRKSKPNVYVIVDPYEFEEKEPHAAAPLRLLWFGHASNAEGLRRLEPMLRGRPLEVISNLPGATPWSLDALREGFGRAGVVLLPASRPWKSQNRAIEAVRQGCFVVAEPHPSLVGFPGIWIGDVAEGLAWAAAHVAEVNDRVREAQDFIRERFSIEACGRAWQNVIQSVGEPATVAPPAKGQAPPMIRVFIGYDPRQPVSAQVAAHSVWSRSSKPVAVTRLELLQLPITRRGLTEFTYSRFLVPWLSGYAGWSIFLDADMLCLDNISDLLDLAMSQPPAPVHVVKNARKFEWASMMVFDCGRCTALTPEYVGDASNPMFNLSFAKLVGDLPSDWNHLVGYDAPNRHAKIVHFTQGVPVWDETKDCEYAGAWLAERDRMNGTVSFDALMGRSVHYAGRD